MRLEYHAVMPPSPPQKKKNQQTVLQQKAIVFVSNWLPANINTRVHMHEADMSHGSLVCCKKEQIAYRFPLSVLLLIADDDIIKCSKLCSETMSVACYACCSTCNFEHL